eukprot:RCo044907
MPAAEAASSESRARPVIHPRKLAAQEEYFQCPQWAGQPTHPGLRLEVFRDKRLVEFLRLDDHPYYLFGRGKKICDHVLEGPMISRLHFALVHHRSGSAFVIDLGSQKGTQLNGRYLEPNLPSKIVSGDELRLGSGPLRYVFRLPTFSEVAGVFFFVRSPNPKFVFPISAPFPSLSSVHSRAPSFHPHPHPRSPKMSTSHSAATLPASAAARRPPP